MISKLLLLILLVSSSAVGQQRSLYWSDITVKAKLDADGKLHIEERQSMVFSGDWNGGERKFRIPLGQELKLDRLTRVDPATGREQDLFPGDLSRIDQYTWADSSTLRWRSRLPGDPFFDNTEIIYVIRYTLSNILVPQNKGYLLDHNFVFPQRSGAILRFTLSLTLDPAWKALSEFETPAGIGPIPPGRGYVVTIPLAYQGPGKPAAVRFGAAAPLRFAFLLIAAVVIAWLLVRFYRREKAIGRFDPLISARSIDERWIQKNILPYSPELAGTIWDESVGSAEVAAILARLVAEGKLQSEVTHGKSKGPDILHLRLVESAGLSGYEHELVSALFFDGSTETNTERIKEHYRESGFDPASKIKQPLEKAAEEILGRQEAGGPIAVSWRPTLALAIGGLALIGIGCLSGRLDMAAGIIGAAIALGLYIPPRVIATIYRKRIVKQLPLFIALMVPLAVMAALLAWALLDGIFQLGAWTLAGLSLLCIAAFHSVLNGARSRENANQIAFRKKFAAAREYFRSQLSGANPALQDAWYPYLLAFGLGENVDRWFRAYGSQAANASPTIYSGTTTGTGGSSTGWTGGGGKFGGAGASASWAVAAGTMAAGVAAPSSQSGSGGGGGHSGGGGGGGW